MTLSTELARVLHELIALTPFREQATQQAAHDVVTAHTAPDDEAEAPADLASEVAATETVEPAVPTSPAPSGG